MKVVLNSTIDGVGRRGEIVDVADGYGRNYLIPKGLAMRAAAGAERQAEAILRVEAQRDARDLQAAQALAGQLSGVPMVIAARASDEGKLFGSVGVTEIVGAAAHAGVEVDRRCIELDEPLKEIGDFVVPVNLHPDVSVNLNVSVIADAG